MSKWMLRQTSADLEKLCRNSHIDPIVARILAVRGCKSSAELKAYFQEDFKLNSPYLFKDLEKMLDLISLNIREHKKIAVYGDYDADGIISTVILCRCLKALKAEVFYFIPERKAGYGMNMDAVEYLKEQGTDLILTCDNGISAHKEIDYALSLGMQVAIIDHHDVVKEQGDEGKESLPKALAIINPKQAQCNYPFKNFCAAALCYIFSLALLEHAGIDSLAYEEEFCVLAAIATVCDLVDLVGENRLIVKRGLALIEAPKNLGLQALINQSGLSGHSLNVYHLGFIIGPCINACGRLATASLGVELFLSADPERVSQLAAQLVDLNTQRKAITTQGVEQVTELIESRGLLEKDSVFVIHSPDIPESVAGIIAGQIKERYYRPTIILSGAGDSLRGSCRSIEGFNITKALSDLRELLTAYGGHPMAAGLSIPLGNLGQFQDKLNYICSQELSKEQMEPLYRIDLELSPDQASLELAKSIQKLEPFGKGNPAPYFGCRNNLLNKVTLLGKDQKVLKLNIRSPQGKFHEIIAFKGKEKLAELIGQRTWEGLSSSDQIYLDFIYYININYYNGNEYLQMQMVDVRLSKLNRGDR